MINAERIVPVSVIDLISLYGLILKQGNANLTAFETPEAPGHFHVDAASASALLLFAEPVSTCDFEAGVSAAEFYFVAGYDYAGFTVDGTAVTVTGDVEKDGRTLYHGTLAGTALTVEKIGF